MNRESALGEFYGWYENAEAYFVSATSPSFIPQPQIALCYLQMAAEYTFKAAIVSISGRSFPSRSPFVLSTRCRNLVPGLRSAARIYSPKKQKLLCYLDPVYCQINRPMLPAPNEWQQLLRLVKQLHKVMEVLCRKRIDRLYN